MQGLFRREFDNDQITVGPETTAHDVAEWDSLSHIQLIVAIEKHFKIRFASKEIRRWENVGQMVDAVSAKLG